jgi:thiamine-phosphate pyrophosphorylase
VTRWSSPAPSQVDERLYLIVPARPDLEEFLEAAIRGGVDIVQIREKELPDGELLSHLRVAREVTRRLGVPLVVNDRPDLAALCEADFVHVGQDDLPVAAARSFGVGVGQSTHAPEEIDAAEADYIGVGPVHATPTKEGRPAVGLELVRYAAAHARQPWFAIGGIDETNVAEVVAAGATRIAVVRAIGDAQDPESAAAALRAVVRHGN